MGSSEIVTVCDIALTFPRAPDSEIDRASVLDTVETIFDAGVESVIVEGTEGMGKTSLLAQYARRHPKRAHCLFFTRTGRLHALSPQVRFDLGNQIHWHEHAIQLDPNEPVSVEEFRNYLLLLQRKALRLKEPTLFILDGLDLLREAQPDTSELLLENLPFGSRNCRFLFSSADMSSTNALQANIGRSRIQAIAPLTQQEAEYILSGTGLSPVEVAELKKTVKGSPARLAEARDLLVGGMSFGDLTEQSGKSATSLVEAQWRAAKISAELEETLGYLTFVPECRSIAFLARVTERSVDELSPMLADVDVLILDRGSITFRSESLERCARRLLKEREPKVLEAVSKVLHASPDDHESLLILPRLLERQSRHEDLVEYLQSDRIAASLRAMGSTAPVTKMLKRAQESASASGNNALIIRTLLQRCALFDLARSPVTRAQLRAALALGDEDAALTIANSAELDEVRASQLSLVVRDQRRRNIPPAEPIVTEVARICGRLDFAELGELVIELAQNLAYVRPDLAANALRSYAKASNNPNALDAAVVTLSLRAHRLSAEPSLRDPLLALDDLASSEATRTITKTIGHLWNRDDPDRMLSEIDGIKDTGEKVFFLRGWLGLYRRESAAVKVALGAAQIILSDGAYAPNATVFRDLASVLPHTQDRERGQRLASIVDSQSSLLRAGGPLVDYYRMRFYAACAPNKSAVEISARLSEEALEVAEISDAALRATTFAWLLRIVRHLGLGARHEDRDGLVVFARDGLDRAVADVLEKTAEHVDAVRGVFWALSTHETEAVLSLANRLNTQSRRGEAHLVIAMALVDDSAGQSGLEFLSAAKRVIDDVEGYTYRRRVSMYLLEHLAQNAKEYGALPEYVSLFHELLSEVRDTEARLGFLSTVCGSASSSADTQFISDLRRDIVPAWNAIEDDYRKILAGFTAVGHLGRGDLESAQLLHKKVREFLAPRLQIIRTQRASRYAALLVGRSLGMLAQVGCIVIADLDTLEQRLSAISSENTRAQLAAQCALIIRRGSPALADQIITRNVFPVVSGICTSGAGISHDSRWTVISCAPAVFAVQESAALTYVECLDDDGKEAAYSAILDFVLNGKIPGEPFHVRGKTKPRLLEASVASALLVMQKVRSDEVLASHAIDILDRIRDRLTNEKLTKNQVQHFTTTIERLAREKLPSKTGVKHDGYWLLISAYVMAARGATQPEWKTLVDRVEGLPNRSDECYVLIRLTSLIPSKHAEFRNNCREKAIAAWRSLPTLEDRIGRLECMFEAWKDDFPRDVKTLLSDCFERFNPESVTEPSQRFRTMVEIAHKLDEDWAASLVSLSDEDPARKMLRRDAAEELEDIAVRKQVCTAGASVPSERDPDDVKRACWFELGVLNATGATMQDWGGISHLLATVRGRDFKDVYPVFAFATAAVGCRYRGIHNMRERVRELHAAISQSAASALNLGHESAIPVSGDRAAQILTPRGARLDLIVRAGERDEALRALEVWLSDCGPSCIDIVDRYFRPKDVEIFSIVLRACPEATVRVLTEACNQRERGDALEEAFRREWNDLGLNVDPPSVIIIVGGRQSDGVLGIHDRWCFAGEKALELGTSFNGIGRDKLTRVRELDFDQAAQLKREVDDLLTLRRRSLGGDRLVYQTISL